MVHIFQSYPKNKSDMFLWLTLYIHNFSVIFHWACLIGHSEVTVLTAEYKTAVLLDDGALPRLLSALALAYMYIRRWELLEQN